MGERAARYGSQVQLSVPEKSSRLQQQHLTAAPYLQVDVSARERPLIVAPSFRQLGEAPGRRQGYGRKQGGLTEARMQGPGQEGFQK